MKLRKKIGLGFLVLALVLLFATGITILEQRRLRERSEQIADLSWQSAMLAESMLDALQIRNSAVLAMVVSDLNAPGPEYANGTAAFDQALSKGQELAGDRTPFAAIYSANENYKTVVENHIYEPAYGNTEWFLNVYLPAFHNLDNAVKKYLTSPERSLEGRADTLENDMYKTSMPSVLTLLVALMLVLMFYLFIDLYYVRPLVRIHDGLKGYMDSKQPFNPVFARGGDELSSLRDMIDELIARLKGYRKEQKQ